MSLALVKRDIAEADEYYAQHGKADAFIAALDEAFIKIADRPLMYPVAFDVCSCGSFRTRCSPWWSPNA